jgi:ABC-type amino acid transport substrate-binding protein
MLRISAEKHGITYGDDIKTMDDDAFAYAAMQAGRIDAYASSAVSLLEFTKTTEGFAVLPFTSDEWAAEYTAMAFRKEDSAFRDAVNGHLLDMKEDGTLAALQMKWFGQSFIDTLPDEPPAW